MLKFTKTVAFLKHLFDQETVAQKASLIVNAILAARSPRLSDIAQHMAGKAAANYKAIQRFLAQADPKTALLRLFQADAPFVIGDPTAMPRPQARKTNYVGTLKDGKTRGYWLLLLATPFRGRAIPCGFVIYSSQTIRQLATSRNQYHWQAFDQVKALLGNKPLVLDREFSYLELLHYLVAADIRFVIRLRLGSHPPTFLDAAGRQVSLVVGLGEKVIHRALRYQGQVLVHVIGVWHQGQREPLWVMSNFAPEAALAIYAARMKVEETFRDLKTLLALDKLMNKTQRHLEQMVALVLLAYTIGLLLGEALRDELFGPPDQEQEEAHAEPSAVAMLKAQRRRKWQLYSGLFILLKQKVNLSAKTLRRLFRQVLNAFILLVQPPVRTHV